ncbi:MAG: hypothetical protein GX654_04930 [Desulfatiglans sp.]|jgi:hypothetical protein|nr:hypothetical protein [Desulfatiglans sp.]
MSNTLLKYLGWVPKEERKGIEINYDNAWEFQSIFNKNEFMSWLIKYVPNDSIWSIEGLYNSKLYQTVQEYTIDDGIKVNRGTVWPRPKYMKIKLSEEAKKVILENINNWNLESDITHQHIYYQNNVYLTSYDNLDCTWLSKDIDQSELDTLEEKGIIQYERDTEQVA